MNDEQGQFSGSCLCGAVRYAFDSEPKVTVASRRPRFMPLAAGTLDDAPELRVAFHAHVASKADLYEIADAVPQHHEQPTKRG